MNDYKTQRKVQRTAFTKILKDLDAEMINENLEPTDVEVQYVLMKEQWETLETTNQNFIQSPRN